MLAKTSYKGPSSNTYAVATMKRLKERNQIAMPRIKEKEEFLKSRGFEQKTFKATEYDYGNNSPQPLDAIK